MHIDECKKEITSDVVPCIPTTFHKTLSKMMDEGLDKVTLPQDFPKFEHVKSTLYRYRNSTNNVTKMTYRDVTAVEIPNKFHSFLLADYCYGDTRIIIFCSKEAKEKLTVLKSFFGDGTFKSCPAPFQQLYTVHGDLGSDNESTAITPLFYALMSNRKKETYEILFSLVKSQIKDWNPNYFTSDFEEAAMSAICAIFPQISIHGCYYHFNNAIWKKGRELNLTKNKTLRRQVALSAVLPLLPEERIFEGWFYVAAESPNDSQSEKFRKYMLSQWLRPNFIKVWCSFDKRHRTNNFAEGWHYKLNSAIGKKNPNILKLLTVLHQDASLYSVKAIQSPKRRKLLSVSSDKYVLDCQIQLINSEISVGHFIEKLA